MVPYVTEMAQRFNATVTVLNAFNLIPDYIADPRIEGTYASEPIPIAYTLDLQELRKQRERRLDDFSHTQFSSVSQTARIDLDEVAGADRAGPETSGNPADRLREKIGHGIPPPVWRIFPRRSRRLKGKDRAS